MLCDNHFSGSTLLIFFNFLVKMNFVQKIGGKKVTEANPREFKQLFVLEELGVLKNIESSNN